LIVRTSACSCLSGFLSGCHFSASFLYLEGEGCVTREGWDLLDQVVVVEVVVVEEEVEEGGGTCSYVHLFP